MRVSINWLKDYVDFDLSPQELAERLTMAGFEVEEIIETVPDFQGVVTGKVLSSSRHPDADKLSVCEVEIPGEKLQVICGAPNVAKGQTIAFAPIGTTLPNGLKIKKAKIRGVESFGMICSEEELGLADHSDGIWVLPSQWKLGTDVCENMKNEADYILDIAITPNRPDAMSMIGMAREVAAITGKKLKKPEIKIEYENENAKDFASVEILNPEGCPRYAAMIIKDLSIEPSPPWLAKRLIAAGVRPINNVVDITNYVLMEVGQPLHAFDYEHIYGQKIVVRESKSSEKFITLDEKERTIPANTVMICDAQKAVAVGGIMGGLNSEVSESTRTVLLESAYFKPSNISRSAKKLGLGSEASARFERGVDPEGIPYAAQRAAMLLAGIAGGKVLKGIIDEYPAKIESKKFQARVERINILLGTKLPQKSVKKILNSLEIDFEKDMVKVPTFRPDLEREADIIEEVARMITFDNIPTNNVTNIEYEIEDNQFDNFIDSVKSNLWELGVNETMTNSMISSRDNKFETNEPVKILNPISDDMNEMRLSLLPGLLRVVAHNLNRNINDLRIFEIGRIFNQHKNNKQIDQPYKLTAMLAGRRYSTNWSTPSDEIDFYDLKGMAESFLDKLSIDNVQFILYDKHKYFESDLCLAIKIKSEIFGYLGKIKVDVAEHWEIEKGVFGLELEIERLFEEINFQKMYNPYSKFPYIEKDLAFVVDRQIRVEQIESVIKDSGKPLISEVSVFDYYTGSSLGENKKSVAFKMRFQSNERTLKDKEVDKVFRKIITAVESKLSAKLRS